MAWPPANEAKVLDVTVIVDNLLGYIEEFGADALAWANGGTALTDFALLLPNAPGQLVTQFPCLVAISQDFEADLHGEVLRGGLEVKFEGCVTGSNINDLTLDAKKYALAVESMLTNISSEDLTAGALNAMTGQIWEIGTSFDLAGQLQNANSYLAVFQVKATYRLTGAAY